MPRASDLAISRQALEAYQRKAFDRESNDKIRFIIEASRQTRMLIQEGMRRLEEEERKRARRRGKDKPKPQKQPLPLPPLPPFAQRPALPVWEPAATEEMPAAASARRRAAVAAAAAATAWATTAAAREAAARAAAEHAASLPRALHTAGAEEWEWAVAAHEALEAARQACPDAPEVQQAEAAVQAAAALSVAQQGWRSAADDSSQT